MESLDQSIPVMTIAMKMRFAWLLKQHCHKSHVRQPFLNVILNACPRILRIWYRRSLSSRSLWCWFSRLPANAMCHQAGVCELEVYRVNPIWRNIVFVCPSDFTESKSETSIFQFITSPNTTYKWLPAASHNHFTCPARRHLSVQSLFSRLVFGLATLDQLVVYQQEGKP